MGFDKSSQCGEKERDSIQADSDNKKNFFWRDVVEIKKYLIREKQ